MGKLCECDHLLWMKRISVLKTSSFFQFTVDDSNGGTDQG